jgi:hypothetical protein
MAKSLAVTEMSRECVGEQDLLVVGKDERQTATTLCQVKVISTLEA